MTKVPLHPKNPERVCWGCDKYCSADALRCGNGTIRTPHPIELFGEDWTDWGVDVPETNKSSLVDNASEKHLSQLHDLNGHHTSMTEASEPVTRTVPGKCRIKISLHYSARLEAD